MKLPAIIRAIYDRRVRFGLEAIRGLERELFECDFIGALTDRIHTAAADKIGTIAARLRELETAPRAERRREQDTLLDEKNKLTKECERFEAVLENLAQKKIVIAERIRVAKEIL